MIQALSLRATLKTGRYNEIVTDNSIEPERRSHLADQFEQIAEETIQKEGGIVSQTNWVAFISAASIPIAKDKLRRSIVDDYRTVLRSTGYLAGCLALMPVVPDTAPPIIHLARPCGHTELLAALGHSAPPRRAAGLEGNGSGAHM